VGAAACKESGLLVNIMEITIRKQRPGEPSQTRSFSRKSIVTSRLVLAIKNEKLTYTIVSVEPYERDVQVEDTDYGFDDSGPTIFFAKAQGRLAGRIKLLKWWNQFAYVEDLVVNPEYRGMHIGRALLEHGIQWARENSFPGVMLETQDDNVPACTLYKSCGFALCGFDRNVYKAIHPSTRETALYWYLMF
jgi:ribosomal protein S18 acetylase RimI-like enzyme